MSARNEIKRIGIWVRVSTEDQVRGESPETHERRARLYAEAKGWQVVEVYRLDAVSGKTVKDTPQARRMLQDVRDGHVIIGDVFSAIDDRRTVERCKAPINANILGVINFSQLRTID